MAELDALMASPPSCEKNLEALAEMLTEHNWVAIDDLVIWLDGQGGPPPLSVREAMAFRQFEKMVASVGRDALVPFLAARQREKSQTALTRNQVVVDVASSARKMVFHRLSPSPDNNYWPFSEVKPFELMETPVTAWMWEKVMGKLPEKFIEVHSNLNPDVPIACFTGNELEIFLTRLNELSEENDPLLKKMISDHRAGDRFKIPTLHQVTTIAALFKSHFSRRAFKETMERAWHRANSDLTLQPVATRLPFVINGVPLFDLVGNVWMVFKSTSQEQRDGYPKWAKWGFSIEESVLNRPSFERFWFDYGGLGNAGSMVGNAGEHVVHGFRLVRERRGR